MVAIMLRVPPLTFGDVPYWLNCEVYSYDTSSQNLFDHFAAFNAR
jgi:uncharacterized membrane protein YjdF